MCLPSALPQTDEQNAPVPVPSKLRQDGKKGYGDVPSCVSDLKIGELELVVVTTALCRLSRVVDRLCDMGLRRLLWLVNLHRRVSTKRWIAIAPDWQKWRVIKLGRRIQPESQSLQGFRKAKGRMRSMMMTSTYHSVKGQRQGVHSNLLFLPFEFFFQSHVFTTLGALASLALPLLVHSLCHVLLVGY